MSYLSHRLPDELVQSLSVVMMPDLVPRIKSVWLDSVVPVSLKEIGDFQETLHVVAKFCDSLKYLNFTGFDELQEWVDSAPKIWLTKCRESALNTVRIKLAQGLGSPQEVERVETQTVSKTERAELAANGAPTGADEDDWGAAWDDDVADHAAGDRDGANRTHEPANQANRNSEADAWGWGEDDTAAGHSVGPESTASPIAENPVSDDGGEDWDAWGHDATEQPALQESAPHSSSKPQTREITLKETYKISSMPEPMLALISTILEDGAFLVA